MAESPLTCEACPNEASFLLVAALFPNSKLGGWVKQFACEGCAEKAREAWTGDDPLYVFALTPVTEGAHR